jgi:hypothetical protein
MVIRLKYILEYREHLLKEYADARLNFLAKKKELEDINALLENSGIKNWQKFSGDYDLWEFAYGHQQKQIQLSTKK